MQNSAPPQVLEYEGVVIGSMLIDKNIVDAAVDGLEMDDFYSTDNRKMFVIMREMYHSDAVIDITTVSYEICRRHGDSLVGELQLRSEQIVTYENIGYYIGVIKSKARRRRLNHFGNRISSIDEDDDDKYFELVDKEFQEARFTGVKNRILNARELVGETVDDLYKQSKGNISGYKTGFEKLDEIIGELMKFKYHLYKWLPKSLIQIEGTEITMPEWLYKKNGLK